MRNSLTILLITSERLVRADVRPGGRPGDCQVVEQSRPAVDDLPSLVEAALRMGSGKPRRVLLLSTEVWTQTLPMAAGAAAGMSEDEVALALAFEAEPFSGISPFDSLGACLSLPRGADEPQFWFTQMAASQREQLDFVVGQAGGRLIGVGHPAGLPVPLRSTPPARWQRIELWPDAVVCLHREAHGPMHVHVINTGPHTETWQHDTEAWFDRFGPVESRETLFGSRRAVLAGEEAAGAEPIDLSDEENLVRWFAAWAEHALGRRPEAPILRPAPKPMSTSTRLAIAGLIGAVMLGLCLVHYGWTGAVTRAAEAASAELRRPAEELRKAQSEADELQKQLASLTAQTERMQASVDACVRAMEWNRQRMVGLMAALAQSDPDAFVVQAIETRRDGIRIRGISRLPGQPNELAARLASTLRPLGLQVHPPTKEAGFLAADGGPYLFELLIQDFHYIRQPLPEVEAAGSSARGDGVATPPESTSP
jgi:Tfp pilus assembly protein PilN